MCLDRKFTAEERKQYLKKRGDILKVYKIVRSKKFRKKYIPECQSVYNFEFKSGLNLDISDGKYIYMDKEYNERYPKGFHAFTTKKAAQKWLCKNGPTRIVACYVKRSWIHTMGIQCSGKVVVTKKIIMPTYDNLEPSQWLITRALNAETKLSTDGPAAPATEG